MGVANKPLPKFWQKFFKEGNVANIKEKVEELVAPIVEGFGLELVEVAYEKKFDGMNLTIFIDKKGGVDLDDCEKVHRAIDEPLDELDPTNGASYTLNVSSCGLDRELKTDKDFSRNIDEELEIKLYQKIENKKEFVGVLKSFTDEKLILENEKGESFEIPRKAISKATKYINF